MGPLGRLGGGPVATAMGRDAGGGLRERQNMLHFLSFQVKILSHMFSQNSEESDVCTVSRSVSITNLC